jgi:hypothetical protein
MSTQQTVGAGPVALVERRRKCLKQNRDKWNQANPGVETSRLQAAFVKYWNGLSPEAIKGKTAKLMSKEARAKAREALLKHGPNNKLALCWSLKSPVGKTYQFKNLGHFVRTNSHLFTAEQMRSTSSGKPAIQRALYALSPRRKNNKETIHGWRWHINGKDPESFLAPSSFDLSGDEQKPCPP